MGRRACGEEQAGRREDRQGGRRTGREEAGEAGKIEEDQRGCIMHIEIFLLLEIFMIRRNKSTRNCLPNATRTQDSHPCKHSFIHSFIPPFVHLWIR